MSANNIFCKRPENYRKYTALRGKVFILEGLIGVGKTTAGQSCADYLNSLQLNAKFYHEYTNDLMLDQYINNMPKYAYAFQLFMLSQRLAIYKDAHNFASTGGIAIIDRSLIGDYTFAYMQHTSGMISDEEWAIYKSILENEQIYEPDGILYLDCDIQVAFDRTIKRGTSSEKQYTLEYFNKLQTAYTATRRLININAGDLKWNDTLTLISGKLGERDCLTILNEFIKLLN